MMSQTFFVKVGTGLSAKVPLHPGCMYVFKKVTEDGPYDERNKSYLELVDGPPSADGFFRVIASRGVVTIQRDTYTPVALNSFIDRCDPNVDVAYASSGRPFPFERVTYEKRTTDDRHPYSFCLKKYDSTPPGDYFYPGARVQLDHIVDGARGGSAGSGGTPTPGGGTRPIPADTKQNLTDALTVMGDIIQDKDEAAAQKRIVDGAGDMADLDPVYQFLKSAELVISQEMAIFVNFHTNFDNTAAYNKETKTKAESYIDGVHKMEGFIPIIISDDLRDATSAMEKFIRDVEEQSNAVWKQTEGLCKVADVTSVASLADSVKLDTPKVEPKDEFEKMAAVFRGMKQNCNYPDFSENIRKAMGIKEDDMEDFSSENVNVSAANAIKIARLLKVNPYAKFAFSSAFNQVLDIAVNARTSFSNPKPSSKRPTLDADEIKRITDTKLWSYTRSKFEPTNYDLDSLLAT